MRALIGGVIAAVAVACGSDGSPSNGTSGTSGSSSTSSSGGECADCGKCGIAGPVGADAVRLVRVGVDPEGRPALQLNLARKDDCEGELLHPSTLRLVDGGGFEHVAGGARPDDAPVSKTGPSTYAWSDRDLALETDAEPDGLFLRFEGTVATMSLACRPGGEIGVCTKSE